MFNKEPHDNSSNFLNKVKQKKDALGKINLRYKL